MHYSGYKHKPYDKSEELFFVGGGGGVIENIEFSTCNFRLLALFFSAFPLSTSHHLTIVLLHVTQNVSFLKLRCQCLLVERHAVLS